MKYVVERAVPRRTQRENAGRAHQKPRMAMAVTVIGELFTQGK